MRGFVGIDWGSSRLRAYVFGPDGRVQDRSASDRGLLNMQGTRFEDVLRETLASWRDDIDRVFLSGMVTSRTGWIETPYMPCPATLSDLPSSARTHRVDGLDLIFLPGLSCPEAPFDVMRGEELQLFGLGTHLGDGLAVLPGTHSKWVRLSGGRVARFRTIVTGELYDLILKHSLIGQLADGTAEPGSAFLKSVQAGYASTTPLADLFGLRARVLLGGLEAGQLATALSGQLIGTELREAIQLFGKPDAPVTVLGSGPLSALYIDAMAAIGIAAETPEIDVTAAGFARIAASFSTSAGHRDAVSPVAFAGR